MPTAKIKSVLETTDMLVRFREKYEEMREVALALREYIDALPDDLALPAMPGVDRDWVDETLDEEQACTGETRLVHVKKGNHLVVLLNLELRNKLMAHDMAEEYNSLFRQLAGRDHESMANRRKP